MWLECNQLKDGTPQVRWKSRWSSDQQHLGAYDECRTQTLPQSSHCARLYP